jgi:endonuclease-3 related protein
VEKAIAALKTAGILEPAALAVADDDELAEVVKPSGYYRQKADRLKTFSVWLMDEWEGDLDRMFATPVLTLREKLLDRKGIGPETADSILLYAGGKPVFVIDNYTKRIVGRVGLTRLHGYDELQQFFERNLPVDVNLYKEYHALLVALGKDYCVADHTKAACRNCPVGEDCENRLLA